MISFGPLRMTSEDSSSPISSSKVMTERFVSSDSPLPRPSLGCPDGGNGSTPPGAPNGDPPGATGATGVVACPAVCLSGCAGAGCTRCGACGWCGCCGRPPNGAGGNPPPRPPADACGAGLFSYWLTTASCSGRWAWCPPGPTLSGRQGGDHSLIRATSAWPFRLYSWVGDPRSIRNALVDCSCTEDLAELAVIARLKGGSVQHCVSVVPRTGGPGKHFSPGLSSRLSAYSFRISAWAWSAPGPPSTTTWPGELILVTAAPPTTEVSTAFWRLVRIQMLRATSTPKPNEPTMRGKNMMNITSEVAARSSRRPSGSRSHTQPKRAALRAVAVTTSDPGTFITRWSLSRRERTPTH